MNKTKNDLSISVEIVVGSDIQKYIDYVSALRISTFKDYPYLYKGSLNYEKKYIENYILDNKATLAFAKVNNKIAGISTGIPLASNSEIVKDIQVIFHKNNIDISRYYYYGETIVLPAYRRQGLTTMLYQKQNELVRNWGFKYTTILTVMREDDDPLKPKGYQKPDEIWKHLGFYKNGLVCAHNWPTIQKSGEVIEAYNKLELWVKNLEV